MEKRIKEYRNIEYWISKISIFGIHGALDEKILFHSFFSSFFYLFIRNHPAFAPTLPALYISFFFTTFIVWLNYRLIGPGGEWIHRLGADSAASGEHEGRLRPGAKRRPICGAFGADWRPLHSKTHEETE